MKSAKFEKAIKEISGTDTLNKEQIDKVVYILSLCATKRDEKHYNFDDESVICIDEKSPNSFTVFDLSAYFT